MQIMPFARRAMLGLVLAAATAVVAPPPVQPRQTEIPCSHGFQVGVERAGGGPSRRWPAAGSSQASG